MTKSQLAWTQVWTDSNQFGTYAYRDSRFERALDKIGHYIQRGIRFKDGERVLEAGCGDGTILLTLLRLFRIQGFGVDFAESARSQAHSLMNSEGHTFNFVLADIQALPFPENYFDKIICLGVVEHMQNPVIPLRELQRVLKPGGRVIIMTPNKFSWGYLDRLVKQFFGLWKFGYQAEFSPHHLSEFLLSAGFTELDSEAVIRRPLASDGFGFRVISFTDRLLNLFFKGWGFYSYVYGTKR